MMAIKLPTNLRGDDHEFEGEERAVNPMSQALYVSPMSMCINSVIEFEEPITEISSLWKSMADALLPRNPLFSCIMVVALLLLLL